MVMDKAEDHLSKLEAREAKKLFEQMVPYSSGARWNVAYELGAAADFRETILIVVGSSVDAQLRTNVPAARLREAINTRGEGRGCRFACVVTDAAVLAAEQYQRCPLIAIGPPDGNQVAARLSNALPRDPAGPDETWIHHDISGENRSAFIRGNGYKHGIQAMEFFISSGLLDKFLEMIWGER